MVPGHLGFEQVRHIKPLLSVEVALLGTQTDQVRWPVLAAPSNLPTHLGANAPAEVLGIKCVAPPIE